MNKVMVSRFENNFTKTKGSLALKKWMVLGSFSRTGARPLARSLSPMFPFRPSLASKL